MGVIFMNKNFDKDAVSSRRRIHKNNLDESLVEQELDMSELIKNAQNGDKSSSEEILKRLKGFIYSKCLKTYIAGYDIEDLVSECNLAVLKAVYKYDVSKSSGAALSYLTTTVLNCLKMLIRSYTSKPIATSLNQKTEEGGNTEIMDMLLDEEDVESIVLSNIDREDIKLITEKLPQRQRELIEAIYFNNLKLWEYAKVSGISPRSLSKVKSRALVNLRKYLEEIKY